jgi:hypothetical protein
MTVTLDSLTLGIVKEVIPNYVSRVSNVDIPMGRGASKQILGSEISKVTLKGYLSGASRYDSIQQLDRYRMLGESILLTSDPITAPVFITALSLDDIKPNSIDYTLALDVALFLQGEAYDSDAYFWVETGGGALTIATATPTPREGTGCIKLSGTIGAGVASCLGGYAPDLLDFSYKDWIAFWYITDNIHDLTECLVTFYDDDGNTATYGFTALITEVDKWYRVLIPKTGFTEAPFAFVWNEVEAWFIQQTHSTEQTYYFAVDDMGAYE